jgi:hypothetical protein
MLPMRMGCWSAVLLELSLLLPPPLPPLLLLLPPTLLPLLRRFSACLACLFRRVPVTSQLLTGSPVTLLM